VKKPVSTLQDSLWLSGQQPLRGNTLNLALIFDYLTRQADLLHNDAIR
jgi:hypothetical protein